MRLGTHRSRNNSDGVKYTCMYCRIICFSPRPARGPPGSHLAPLDKSASLAQFQGCRHPESSVNG